VQLPRDFGCRHVVAAALGFCSIGCQRATAPSEQVPVDASATCVGRACLDASNVDADSGPSAASMPLVEAGVTTSTTTPPDAAVELTDAGGPRDAGLTPDAFVWQLPLGFPQPPVPADNPMTYPKVELGRHLFYDPRLSRDDNTSCSSCHKQELAFTDGLATSVGITGQHTPRNSMMLGNVAYASTLTWANPLLLELERQALVPMFGDNPVELGLRSEQELEDKLAADPDYQELFERAFPEDDVAITTRNAVFALSAFQRTLLSGDSPFDRFLYGNDPDAIPVEAQRGYELFNSEKLECFHCHVGFNLSDHVTYQDKPFIDRPFHNTGLYNIDGNGAYPEPNTGVHSVTLNPKDMGRFRAPSLRNIAVTAPYMHDGSIATLDEVLDHYARGGRKIASGPNAGDGRESPLKDSLIVSFELSDAERKDVLAFLNSLTDESFLTNPQFSNPWLEKGSK
jgi:cytochrome c peroxidase